MVETYLYTGKLADFRDLAFPDAKPRLWVAPREEGFGVAGSVLSVRRVPVTVAPGGTFSVPLVASVDVSPNAVYVLRVEWLDDAGVPRGWSDWEFIAAVGGGPISDMEGEIVTRVWFGVDEPPVSRAGIFWVHPVTGDVREWVES